MFPGGDMQAMLAQAQQLQQQLADAQEELARTHVQGTASGGLVTATVTGAGELIGLEIAPAAVEGESGPIGGDANASADLAETLADLVLAAVRDATANAADLQARTMEPLTAGLGGLAGGAGLGLPGM